MSCRPKSLCLAPVIVVLAWAGAASRAEATEEFNGPFPSWRDLRRDYGARGDGKADDTAALQRALDELVKHEKSCVLYLPAGKYRLTQTVKTVRKGHTDCLGVAVVGEDPATTALVWDGEAGGTMFQWDAWYSQVTRLTFDGAGRAGAALVYGPAFSTYNETSDIVFKDAKAGLVFGGPKTPTLHRRLPGRRTSGRAGSGRGPVRAGCGRRPWSSPSEAGLPGRGGARRR
jgi:hypothetical protein